MTLQKSFSEQNRSHRTQARPQWNRSKSHSNANPDHPAAARARPAKPLEPVSEVTKSKLNAFNFRPPSPAAGPVKPVQNDSSSGNGENAIPAELSLPETASGSATPVNRLKWNDLIGAPQQGEDRYDASPNERILWDTKQAQLYKASPVMSRKKGKKRARSSSPTSSPAARSKSKSHTPVVNVKKLAAALKSPHADPALELWDRFSCSGSTSATSLGATNPALAQIMVSSSPQPSKVLGTVPAEGGLRRTISCGAQWPKRRRVDRADSVEPLKATAEESPSGASKSSMVNDLLKSVTGGINKSKAAQVRDGTLKSPSPKKRRRHPTPPIGSSPTRRMSPLKSVSPLLAATDEGESGQVISGLANGDVSDYGGDDFDDETLMELDAGLVTSLGEADDGEATLPPPAAPPLPDADTGQEPRRAAHDESLLSSDDEFADLDDDVFAVAEDLITQIDANANNSTTSAHLAPEPLPETDAAGEDLSEDIYGDDFGGDFDFEAAEIAATQSAKQTQTSGSLPPVGRLPYT